MTQEERDAGMPLHLLVRERDGDFRNATTDVAVLNEVRGEWLELARRYGARRAAWVIRSLRDETKSISGPSASSKAPTLFLLPRRFVVILYKNGQPAYTKEGNQVRKNLPIFPSASAPTEDVPPVHALFDENSKWLLSFTEAVNVGLGVQVSLSALDSASPELHFSHIVAVGLYALDPKDGIGCFETFVESHHYTDGIEFLPYGAVTTNTADAASAYSVSDEKLLEAFDHEILSPLLRLSDERRGNSAAAKLARAVGLRASSDLFDHVKGADLVEQAEFPDLLETLWPATGDYVFSHMLTNSEKKDGRAQLLQHVKTYLRPRGIFSTLRIGNFPFGLLPASRIRPRSANDPFGWENLSARDHFGSGGSKWDRFDDGLFRALTALLPLWTEKAQDPSMVPRVGATLDPDEEILRILGMSPYSLDYRVRPIVDHALIRVLLMLFGGRLFGIDSAFGGMADENTSIAQWVAEKERITDAAESLLQRMGTTGMRNSPLLRAFYWGSGERLYMPLVQDPGVPTDNPATYLPQLLQYGANASPALSNTLLYDLIRRSLAINLQLPMTEPTSEVLKRLTNLPVLEFFNNAVTASRLEALAARIPVMDLPDSETLASFVDRLNAQNFEDVRQIANAFGSWSHLFASLATRLRQDFVSRLESSLTDVIDSLTYRLDAWYSSLAARRLDAMQSRNREFQPHSLGVYWGAYGYLENLSFSRNTAAGGQPATGGGFIHAPSVAHATAAAMLRSAYDSHREDDSRKAYTANLSSSRVRRARTLIEGIQQGQSLAALLGYQFERGLHDESLDRLIDDFRRSFPVEIQPERDADEPQETIPPHNVVDGRALSQAYTQPQSFSGHPDIVSLIGQLKSAEQKKVRDLLYDLADCTDAVGDCLLFESVFQAVQGNYDRSGAAMDACSGIGCPPDLNAMATPIVGSTLRHRVCLMFPCTIPADKLELGARAQIEPRFNAWVRSILGSFSTIGYRAYVSASGAAHSSTLDFDLGNLDPPLSALDFLYLCTSLPSGIGTTEIEVRLRRHVRADPRTPQGATIRLAFDEPPTTIPGARSVNDAMELGRTLLDMMGSANLMTPAALTHPDDVSEKMYEDSEVEELRNRALASIGLLVEQENALKVNDAATIVHTLHACNGFGVEEALLESTDPASIEERRVKALNIVSKRIVDANALIASATSNADTSVPTLLSVFRKVFGESYLVFPTFDLSLATRKATSVEDATMNKKPTEDRVWLWLQQVAETHPRVRRLETLLMAAEAWGTVRGNPLLSDPKVIQVPAQVDFGWQALSDAELGTKLRAKGRQSIVSFAPNDFSLRCVSGFVIDEWTETIPAATISTGLSFEHNQPGSQAPNCILLAVPGNFRTGVWTEEHLAEIVRDTMDLAKIRLVDLDALPATAGIAPALLFPISQTTPTTDPATDPGFVMPTGFNTVHDQER
ncbi:MAG: hypothetical protein LAO78_13325 [Acidobacteriia bacterium]|nr:hypothetical protein [Terriglobia bacterium]